jgi:hypothetical protein
MYWRYWCSHGFGQIFFVLLIGANDGKSDDPAWGSSVSINYKRGMPHSRDFSTRHRNQIRAALGDTHPSGDHLL